MRHSNGKRSLREKLTLKLYELKFRTAAKRTEKAMQREREARAMYNAYLQYMHS